MHKAIGIKSQKVDNFSRNSKGRYSFVVRLKSIKNIMRFVHLFIL